MNNTIEYMKDRIFEIRGGGGGVGGEGGGGEGPLNHFLDALLQVEKYKEVTGLDVYSLDI